MNTANQVRDLIEKNKADKVPLSEAIWNTALACVGWPYVYGAWGAECTPSERKRRYKPDHDTYAKCQVCNGSKSSCSGCKWLPNGQHVLCFDCRGFTAKQHRNYGLTLDGDTVGSQWSKDSNWKSKGPIATIPNDVLVCLFQWDDSKKKFIHTGLGYKGQTVECQVGVQYFKTRDRKWTHWAVVKGIDGEVPDYKPTIRRGSKGEYVEILQRALVQRGYNIGSAGVDGNFGRGTEAAVKEFQRANGLNADGICGPLTWAAIDGEAPSLYTVTIPHLTSSKANQLLKDYPNATMTEEGR